VSIRVCVYLPILDVQKAETSGWGGFWFLPTKPYLPATSLSEYRNRIYRGAVNAETWLLREAMREKDPIMLTAISPFGLVNYRGSYKEGVSSRRLRRELLENEGDHGISIAGLGRMDRLIAFS
jgi:hypothetical protein